MNSIRRQANPLGMAGHERKTSMGFRTVRACIAGLGLSLVLACSTASVRAAEFSADQKAAIQAIIKEYLVQNPEVLREAMVELDRRQKEKEQQAQLSITA